MVDGSAISSRKEVEGLNGTGEETADGWKEAIVVPCVRALLSGAFCKPVLRPADFAALGPCDQLGFVVIIVIPLLRAWATVIQIFDVSITASTDVSCAVRDSATFDSESALTLLSSMTDETDLFAHTGNICRIPFNPSSAHYPSPRDKVSFIVIQRIT